MGHINLAIGLLLVSVNCVLSQNVNLLEIAETCRENFITQDYDIDWEARFDNEVFGNQWRFSMASRLFIYITGLNMYETNNYAVFKQSHFDSSCMSLTRVNNWNIVNVTGYTLDTKPLLVTLRRTNDPKILRFAVPNSPTGPAEGTASIILSDNNSFTVFEFCFDNGLRTFAVVNRTPLSSETKRAIMLHLKSLGFKDKNFVDTDNDRSSFCTDVPNILTNRVVPVSTDLPVPVARTNFRYPPFVDSFLSRTPYPTFYWKKK